MSASCQWCGDGSGTVSCAACAPLDAARADRAQIVDFERAVARAEAIVRRYLREGDAETSVRVAGARGQIAKWKEQLAALRGTKEVGHAAE